MGHAHNVYDADPYFVINADTRVITDESETGTSLMQYDHNSERITFEIDRLVDEHDMSECDRVEVHYINIGTDGKRSDGVYEVDDVIVDPEDDQIVKFTWLVSQQATMHAGSLSFVIRFICTTDGNFDYVWNTDIYNKISVGKGINNAEIIVTQYADVLQNWYNEFIAAGNDGVARIEKATEDALAEIEQAKDDMIGGLSEDEFVKKITEEATKATMDNLDTETIADVVLDHIKESTVTEIDATVTDEQYPTAKAVYDVVDKTSIHDTVSGEVIRVDDVNPMVHNVKAKVKSKNLLDFTKAVARLDTQSVVVDKSTNSLTFSGNYYFKIPIELPANKTVVFSCESDSYEGYYVFEYDDGTLSTHTATSPRTTEKPTKHIYIYKANSTVTEENIVFKNLQLEEGDTATEYTPYVDPTTVTVTRCGKNLLNPSGTKSQNGVSLTMDENGVYTISGTTTASINLNVGTAFIKAGRKYKPTVFVYSGSFAPSYWSFATKQNMYKDADGYLSSEVDTEMSAFIYASAAGSTYDAKFAVMLELVENAEDGNYEPYTGATYTPDSDGTVDGVTSVSPTMTIFTDKAGVTIEAEYNQDMNVVFDAISDCLEAFLYGGE